MPEVTFRPINQCTLDDPTDGAEPPSVVPDTSSTTDTPYGPDREPPCHPAQPAAGGSPGDECTDALVRRFTGEGGAPPSARPASENDHKSACFVAAFQALASCGPLLAVVEATPLLYVLAEGTVCGAALGDLLACQPKDDRTVR